MLEGVSFCERPWEGGVFQQLSSQLAGDLWVSLSNQKRQWNRAMLTPGLQNRASLRPWKIGAKAWLIRKTSLKLNSKSQQQGKEDNFSTRQSDTNSKEPCSLGDQKPWAGAASIEQRGRAPCRGAACHQALMEMLEASENAQWLCFCLAPKTLVMGEKPVLTVL